MKLFFSSHIATRTKNCGISSRPIWRRSSAKASSKSGTTGGSQLATILQEASLDELKARNPGLETHFRRIDANHFQAALYRNGAVKSRCKIWLSRNGFPNGIAYSHNDSPSDRSLNELLSVHHDDQKLFLKPLGMTFHIQGSSTDQKLSQEGGAEYFWASFIDPLQR